MFGFLFNAQNTTKRSINLIGYISDLNIKDFCIQVTLKPESYFRLAQSGESLNMNPKVVGTNSTRSIATEAIHDIHHEETGDIEENGGVEKQ